MFTPDRLKGWHPLAAAVASALLIAAAPAGGQALLEIAGTGQTDAAIKLLRKGAEIDATAADGSTALIRAVQASDDRLVAALLKAKANVNIANRYGVTPLIAAASGDSRTLPAMLVKAGADAKAAFGRDGDTALMVASRSGNAAAVEALLGAGADVNARETRRGQTALMMAAGKGHAGIVRLLANAGAELDVQDAPVFRNLGRVNQAGGGRGLPAGGMSALMFAAREGQRDAAIALLDAGAAIDAAEGEGWTALLLAIVNTHYTLAADLVNRGADLERTNHQGLRPLYAAVEMRLPDVTSRPNRPERDAMTSLELVTILLEKGADANGRLQARVGPQAPSTGAPRGTPPGASGSGGLPGAAPNADAPPVARAGVAGAPPVGSVPPVVVAGVGAGGTAFMRAVRGGDLEVMRVLLEHGADPRAVRHDGTNALMIAGGVGAAGFGATPQNRGFDNLLTAIKQCQEAGLDINALNADGVGALHGAASSGNELMIRVLHAAGADLTLKNRDGLTALEVAEGKGPAVRGRKPTPQPAAEVVLRELLGESSKVANNI